jgi:ABC-type siderophore export system fused ATPase/permease subunit
MLIEFVEVAVKTILTGGRRARMVFFSGFALVFAAILLAALADSYGLQKTWHRPVAAGLGIIGALLILGVAIYGQVLATTAREKKIEEVEERARKHPNEPQAAWDLARVKLESYLNRNLRQVQWIFVLTLLVMIAGFVIIGYGVIRVYQSPENFKPSVVVTVSGVIVEFIAATFLLIYRSTMEQARSYVTMLEKINAVGMSIQILDTMKSNDTDKFRAQLAMELLSLYGTRKGFKDTP